MGKPRYWYRVLLKSGEILCETGDPEEARETLESAGPGAKLQRAYEIVKWSSWERWDGTPDAPE